MGLHIPEVRAFFDDDSNTISYVVSCAETRHAAIIDSVLGLDYASGGISYQLADFISDQINKPLLAVPDF